MENTVTSSTGSVLGLWPVQGESRLRRTLTGSVSSYPAAPGVKKSFFPLIESLNVPDTQITPQDLKLCLFMDLTLKLNVPATQIVFAVNAALRIKNIFFKYIIKTEKKCFWRRI